MQVHRFSLLSPSAALARATHLESLDLSDTLSGLPFDDAQQTFEAFANGIKDLHLKYLDLSDNALGPGGFTSCKGLIEVALARA